MNARVWWWLTVHGYGRFLFFGTIKEAQMRLAWKMNWEGGRGYMTPVEYESLIAVENEKNRLRDARASGVQLEPNELEAIA